MSHHRFSMLNSLMNGSRHDRMSWTGMAVTSALVFVGVKMIMNIMDDD